MFADRNNSLRAALSKLTPCRSETLDRPCTRSDCRPTIPCLRQQSEHSRRSLSPPIVRAPITVRLWRGGCHHAAAVLAAEAIAQLHEVPVKDLDREGQAKHPSGIGKVERSNMPCLS
jgi:hypothetical protein